jgi:hypothetical protein
MKHIAGASMTSRCELYRGTALAVPWSFYISLMTFIGVSPVGALESSPWRKPWEQIRTARSPVGAKESLHVE